MVQQDEFEMENQGYEEEPSTRPEERSLKRTYFGQPLSLESSRSLPISQETIIRPIVVNSLRAESEAHVYEDIVVSGLEDSIGSNNSSFRLPENFTNKNNHCDHIEKKWEKNPHSDDNNLGNFATSTNDKTSNFHRNLTLPLRRTIDAGYENSDNSCRFSVRVTNRERTRCLDNENEGSIYDTSVGSGKIVNDNDDVNDHENEGDSTRQMSSHRVVDKSGRRRRKKDCKHCKSKANNSPIRDNISSSIVSENSSNRAKYDVSTFDVSRERFHAGNMEIIGEENIAINCNREPIFALPDCKLPIFSAQSINSGLSRLSPLADRRTNTIFSISNNANCQLANTPKPLNYDKNDTDPRLVSIEHTDQRALITPAKNRAGMKVNSIYSQDNRNTKDAPIFLTGVKEQHFQRAYSLPTRTQTPSSQNRLNLRRSVRGEPPPHPARLRKNRHGWTLHFARPLDGTGCTRSIVLLLIAILALLGIGGIALYIVFEPEKLQIIQQYLRSSTTNTTTELNSTFVASTLDFETNVEITTFQSGSFPLTDSPVGLSRETTFTPETETQPVPTTASSEITLDRNVTRHCDDCYETEVCVALVDEEVPICRNGPDPLDPTGCDGLCLINKQKCHRLDFDAFRCVEVEHYCLDDEWTCSNTLCIPLVKHCDGHMNCYDHSDEYDCACDLQTHFQCGNETSCLPMERRCDGKIDCWDATDEINCTLGEDLGWSCPSSGEFTCSNGECILKARFCDGLRDCTDGSDEPHGCQGRCNKHEFSCLNGRCITKAMKCNGIDDCGDGSDERHCRDRILKKLDT